MIEHIVGMVLGSIFILFCVICFFIFYTKNKKYRASIKRLGQKAEVQINDDLKVWAKHTKNYFIPASLYKYHNNKYFEVDGILVTNRALIIIEIKSIKGGIVGDCQATYWTKKVGHEQFKMLNPAVQNERHIDHIVQMTDMRIPTLSLIIFSNRANYINITNIPSHVLVTKHADMFETLDGIDHALPLRFSDYEMKNIVLNIRTFRTNKRSDVAKHRKIATGGYK